MSHFYPPGQKASAGAAWPGKATHRCKYFPNLPESAGPSGAVSAGVCGNEACQKKGRGSARFREVQVQGRSIFRQGLPTSQARPNLRVSLKTRRCLLLKSSANRSCFSKSLYLPFSSQAISMRISPLMRRWMSRVQLVSVNTRNFPRRERDWIICPFTWSANCFGSGAASVRSHSSRAEVIWQPMMEEL